VYAPLLVIASGIAMLKGLALGFTNLEKHRQTQRSWLSLLDIVLLTIQFWAAFSAINHLTLDTFSKDTLQWLSLANIAFFVQAFLGYQNYLVKYVLINLGGYLLLWLLLYFKVFDLESFVWIQEVALQQFIGVLVVGLEAYLGSLMWHRCLTKNS
jgi:hypothetical protein